MWVVPGARRSEVAGTEDGRLRLRLAAPAHEGKANAELVRYVAELFGVRRRQVTIAAGASARRKVVDVQGVTIDEAGRILRLREG